MHQSLTELYSLHTNKVSDKWSFYLLEYERIFFFDRNRPINLLEIGIQNGGSLEIWAKYFPNAVNIIGCDINPDCSTLNYSEPNIHLFVGNANDSTIHRSILEVAPKLDIVIDDGSHKSSDIVRSFALYFPDLEEGGLYIAEDLHCSYWKPFEGGLCNQGSSIEFFKKLSDITNFEHWTTSQSRLDIIRPYLDLYECSLREEDLSKIHSVEFVNSLCIIRKCAIHKNQLGHRVIVGSVADVNVDILPLRNSAYQIDPNLLDVNQSKKSSGISSIAKVLLSKVWERFLSIFA